MEKSSNKMRKLTSIILVLSFIILSVTGLQLSVGGEVKRPVTKTSMVESKVASGNIKLPHTMPFYPKKAHEWMGYIFILAGVAHLMFNSKQIMAYMKRK